MTHEKVLPKRKTVLCTHDFFHDSKQYEKVLMMQKNLLRTQYLIFFDLTMKNT